MVPEGTLFWCDIASNLGQAYAMRPVGDAGVNFARARQWYQRVAVAEGIDDNPRGYADTNYKLGTLTLKEGGDIRHALDCLERARAGYERAGHGQSTSVYLAMHQAYEELGDHDRAVDCLERSLDSRDRHLSPLNWAPVYGLLAFARLDRGNVASIDAALAMLRASLAALTSADAPPLTLGTCHRQLAGVLRDRHRLTGEPALTQAREHLTEAALLSRDDPGLHTVIAAELGDVLAAAAEWPAAADAYRSAVDAADDLYRTLVLTGSRELSLAGSAALRHRACYALAKAGRPAEAVVMAESGRTRLIGEALAHTAADLEQVRLTDPAAHAAFVATAERVRMADLAARTQSDLEPARAQSGLGPARILQLGNESAAARRELAAAIDRIRAMPGHATFLASSGFADISSVAEPDHPLVYALCTGFGSLALLVVRPAGGGPAEVTAAWDDLTDEQLTAVREASGAPDTGGVDAAGAMAGLLGATYAMLPPEAARLTVIPCGQLGLVPVHLAAVPVAGGPARPIGELIPVGYALSAETALLARRAPGAGVPFARLVVVGDPRSDIAAATDEARLVARSIREPTLLLRSAATVEAVLGRLGEPGRGGAHFACHGRYAPDPPLDSGLVLADGDLTLRLLLDTRPRPFEGARLVVMSACESAVVHGGNPDETLGLPAAVTSAGARCVVGTLWRVDDVPTEALIRRFYRELLDRLDGPRLPAGAPIEAMSAAQAWTRRATTAEVRRGDGLSPELRTWLGLFDDDDRPFRDPLLWAAFVVVGS